MSGHYATLGLQFDEPTEEDLGRAEALLDFLDAGRIASQRYDSLSQGERQKVLIARALMARPQLLILDEPCAGLDIASRERLLSSIEKLARSSSPPTLIMVTHHVEEIVPAFERALVLKGGQIAAQGPLTEVLTSAVLSRVFGLALEVRCHGGRYSAVAAGRADGGGDWAGRLPE